MFCRNQSFIFKNCKNDKFNHSARIIEISPWLIANAYELRVRWTTWPTFNRTNFNTNLIINYYNNFATWHVDYPASVSLFLNKQARYKYSEETARSFVTFWKKKNFDRTVFSVSLYLAYLLGNGTTRLILKAISWFCGSLLRLLGATALSFDDDGFEPEPTYSVAKIRGILSNRACWKACTGCRGIASRIASSGYSVWNTVNVPVSPAAVTVFAYLWKWGRCV